MNLISTFAAVYLVLAALLVGSFINLTADRLPRGESIVQPRSHCRSCGRELNLVDLIPVLGYFLRGGRCASCKAPIGVMSPLVEAVSGCLVAGALLWQGLWPGALVGLALLTAWGLAVTFVAIRRGAPGEIRG